MRISPYYIKAYEQLQKVMSIRSFGFDKSHQARSISFLRLLILPNQRAISALKDIQISACDPGLAKEDTKDNDKDQTSGRNVTVHHTITMAIRMKPEVILVSLGASILMLCSMASAKLWVNLRNILPLFKQGFKIINYRVKIHPG